MISTKIQIRFSDCDMMQHVNNAVYLNYFELARIQFFNTQAPSWDWNKNGIILAKNTIDYKQPVFLTDQIEIEVNCTHIGQSSFTLSYHLFAQTKTSRILKTYGESVLVCFDFNKNTSVPLYPLLIPILKNNLI